MHWLAHRISLFTCNCLYKCIFTHLVPIISHILNKRKNEWIKHPHIFRKQKGKETLVWNKAKEHFEPHWIFLVFHIQYLKHSIIRRSFSFQSKNTRTFPSKWYIAEKKIILLSLTGSTCWFSPFSPKGSLSLFFWQSQSAVLLITEADETFRSTEHEVASIAILKDFFLLSFFSFGVGTRLLYTHILSRKQTSAPFKF